MAWGSFKKVVVGDCLAPFVHQVYDDPRALRRRGDGDRHRVFAFQLYCDFRGYSDLAIGAARMHRHG